MKINYEDISSYTTALCTIAGAAVIGPLLIIKDKVSAILDARKNPAQEYSCQTTPAQYNSSDISLAKYKDNDGWNVITIIGDHSTDAT